MQARDAATAAAELAALRPPGWAAPKEGTDLHRLREAMGAGIAAVERAAAGMVEEIDPRAAILLLEDFERVLGPDPCGRWELVTTTAERQLVAWQRWTSRGGASAAYFIALAAAMGVTITIETDIPGQIGAFECGDEIVESPEQFVWRVNLPATQEFDPIIGEFEAGDLLGWLVPSLVECVIRRYAPAHTVPVISYA